MSIFELETLYLLGNYQGAINLGNTIRSRNEDSILRDYFVYRSYVEQGDHRLVLDEIRSNANIALIAVQVYAAFAQNPLNHEKVFGTIQSWIDSGEIKNELVRVVVGCIYYRAGKYEDCLRVLHDTTSLEGRAILVQLYLSINRIDYAQKEFKTMQAIKDDAPLTQLAFAWISLQEKTTCKEAVEIYKDLKNKYGSSVLLENGLAVATMALGDYERSEKILLDALTMDPKSIVTKTNLIVVGQLLDRPSEKIKRDISQLTTSCPDHPWILSLNKASSDFDNAQSKFLQQ